MRIKVTAILAWAALVLAPAVAAEEPAAADLTGLLDTSVDAQYGFLQQQIYRGESAEAQNQLETIVSQVEAAFHRYHEDLVIPLTLIGDAYMVQQEYDEALDHYDRARHIARVSYGLFDPRQLAVVYREADAFKKIGDLASAGQREEYAYEVVSKSYDAYDPELLPPLHRLAEFYLQTYNYLAARALYNRALRVHERNGTANDPAAVETLSGIATSHQLERFPPFYVANPEENRLEGPRPGLTTTDLDNQHLTFNNFPAGERALQKIIEIKRSTEPEDKADTLQAILQLADWHQMFGRSNAANTLYSHVFEEMQNIGEDAAGYFADPLLIYLPQPHDPKPPPVSRRDTRTRGMVTLEFDVVPTGRIRKLKTIEAEPPKLMDFRVRRSMRQAVYRPRLLEGVAVVAEGQTYTHEFDYFPAADKPPEDNENTASSGEAVPEPSGS